MAPGKLFFNLDSVVAYTQILADFNNCALRDLLKIFMNSLHIIKYVYTPWKN
jgi:hypothetical protein